MVFANPAADTASKSQLIPEAFEFATGARPRMAPPHQRHRHCQMAVGEVDYIRLDSRGFRSGTALQGCQECSCATLSTLSYVESVATV
jgi:hypothetical protein